MPGGFLVTFRRLDASIPARPIVEYSGDFFTYQPAVNGVNGVVITVIDDGFDVGVDQVEVFLPNALASNSGLFTRLSLDKNVD